MDLLFNPIPEIVTCNTIKLESYSHICIDLKVVLEIPTIIIVQLAFRNSLAKKRISIRGEIIDTEYVGNIIAILQNDSEKTYIIKPNEKIAQAIFLSLVKITRLVLMRNREELRIIAKGIQRFRSTDRIDIPINMAEKKAQIFEAKPTICKSEEIGLINLYIPAKNKKHIKIPIYNTPNPISDFPQLCEYVDITSQTIYGQNKCYLLQPEQLEQMNMGNLDPLQYMQLKILLNNFNNIFASENEFGHTNIIQHQIKTENTMPIKQ
ncbi:hypothetical protein G9A89_003194 [Geosiphon pyriformis]|nr:hypothetical protein G9A89_003194 [Geosiphon pyriformis]